MGEIADMMLDGTLCEGCGVYIGGEGSGFPRHCSRECARNCGSRYSYEPSAKKFTARKDRPFSCPVCTKRFMAAEHVDQHRRDKHGTRGSS